MPSFVLPGCVLVRLIWQAGGTDVAVNVVGAYNTNGVAVTQALTDTVGAAIKAQRASSGLNAVQSNVVRLSKVGLRDINSPNLPEFLDANAATAVGTATDPLPANVAYCVTLRTGLVGKSYRGRFYVYGLSESANDANGLPSAAALTACLSFVTGIKTALAASNLEAAVLSRKVGVHNDWTTPQNRNTTWSTQRRRLIPGI